MPDTLHLRSGNANPKCPFCSGGSPSSSAAPPEYAAVTDAYLRIFDDHARGRLWRTLGDFTTCVNSDRCLLMGWSGRAPAPPAISWPGRQNKEHAISQKPTTAVAVIGIDIGKNSFQVVGHDARGAIVLRQKWSRGQVEARLANIPPCLIGMEACVGAHHLSRKLASLGHDSRLMPAKYVRP